MSEFLSLSLDIIISLLMSKPNSIINISLTVDWSLEIVRHAGQKYVLVLYLEFLFLSLLNLRDVNEQEYLHL